MKISFIVSVHALDLLLTSLISTASAEIRPESSTDVSSFLKARRFLRDKAVSPASRLDEEVRRTRVSLFVDDATSVVTKMHLFSLHRYFINLGSPKMKNLLVMQQ